MEVWLPLRVKVSSHYVCGVTRRSRTNDRSGAGPAGSVRAAALSKVGRRPLGHDAVRPGLNM